MIYGLFMNNIHDRGEVSTLVAYASSVQALLAFVAAESVAPYREGEWQKCFRKDGPLEWFKPCQLSGVRDWFGQGIGPMQSRDEFLADKAVEYDEMLSRALDADVVLGNMATTAAATP